MKAECPVCLKWIDVPPNSPSVTCPYCGTELKVMYQKITVSLDAVDLGLAAVPAVLSALGIYSSFALAEMFGGHRLTKEGRKARNIMMAFSGLLSYIGGLGSIIAAKGRVAVG